MHVARLMLLLLPSLGPSQSDAQILEQAEKAFQEGTRLRVHAREARPLFREAADLYEELRRRGIRNPDLFRDQGSAYLLGGELPQAILAYRRGLRLAPADRDLQARLQIAREQVTYADASSFGRPPLEHRPPWLPYLRPQMRLILALLFHAVAGVALTRWLMTRGGAALWVSGLALLAGALLAASLALDEWENRRAEQQPLVVLAEDGVLLRRGNGLAYPPRSEVPLNRGVEARLLFAKGDWLQIELADGAVGWVLSKYALLDEP
jgi:hypothetical protein